MPRAVIILADGFEEVEAITCVDLLRRAGVEVPVLGLSSPDVRGAHDIWVRADMRVSEFAGQFDALILPGGMPGANNLAASSEVLDMVRRANERGNICAAICAAPIVLAAAGILGGRKATCYPGFESKLAGALLSDDPVVSDGNIITSRGMGTAIPFALELIKVLTDDDTAKKIGSSILYDC